MAFLRNKWAVVALAMLCWPIIASFSAGYYYYQYSDLLAKTCGTIIHVDIGINYGRDRQAAWFNRTEARMG
ncbi:MAG: hypothetical protein AOA65_0920 [Candidatus Bathyarchaeota archaeon BA1]|nr:MAG: hypothetical protein AOA65_0920 [Candidatus Bathyarchaeota archaeon BA1]